MKKKRDQRPQRKMKPVFLVFCEGDTEEAYINFLRREYRLSIKVIPRVTGLSLSQSIIRRYIQAEKLDNNDKITTFLMYDLDIKSIAEKIAACKSCISIASNPSVELWFLLHFCEQKAAVSAADCIEKIRKISGDWLEYKKGTFTEKQKRQLWENRKPASARARQLREGENPSSSVYRLIEEMDAINAQGR